jgi:hypothetical protein
MLEEYLSLIFLSLDSVSNELSEYEGFLHI